MGVNYYFKIKEKRQKEIENFLTDLEKKLIGFNTEIHIGKSSAGWTFSFQETPFYKSYKELLKFYEDNKNSIEIVDEYGDKIDIDYFKKLVEDKKKEEFNYTKYIGNDEEYVYLDEEGNSFTKNYFS